MSLFNGTPITAQTSSQTTTETPKWLQDAIYNQIQTVQNVAGLPFQAYNGQLVAGPTQNQNTAWNSAATQGGNWQGTTNTATQGLQGLSQAPSATAAANPYLQRAGQSSVANINQYMNPYTQNVTDRIAQLGARNLSENLLPQISDSFVQAGQFGGSRMGEFGARALRDTQDSILGQQANALQSGYNTALGASQNDLARQMELGSAYGSLANTDRSGLQSVYNSLLGASQQGQQQGAAQRAELSGYGADQRNIQQQNLQSMYDQYLRSQQYPQQQTNYLTGQLGALAPQVSNVQRTESVSPAGYNPSTASTLLGGLSGIAALLNP